jgi:simple sugar transport system ATP-binding protein
VLILDELTAVLSSRGERTCRMRPVAGGRTVVFISHKLNEVLEVSDRATVLRGGKHVITRDAAGNGASWLD